MSRFVSLETNSDDETLVVHLMVVKDGTRALWWDEAFDYTKPVLRVAAVFEDAVEIWVVS